MRCYVEIHISRELEVSVDHEKGRAILCESLNSDVVSSAGGDCGYIEGEAVGPTAGLNWLYISKVLVVDESAEEVAFEVDDANVGWLDKNTAEVEVDSWVELGWVGVAECLGLIQEEVAHVVDLFEHHAVGDGSSDLKGFVEVGSLVDSKELSVI